MNPKIIAHYLPQFYDVSENNTWWGDGFTEWTNVKKAKPLFKGHIQPKIPLNNNYYNTLDVDTRKWQGELAKEYGIYGFCYYHYWFAGKKLLLEKPAELMLKDGYPDIPFCFSWGNGNWARTREGQPEEILMLQEYGDERDWEDHFNYLLPFFQSSLYIRKDDKPVFLIHYSKHMKDVIEQMIQKWDLLAQKNNIPGIYVVEVITSSQTKPYANSSSAIMEFEPHHSIKNFSIFFIGNVLKHLINRIAKYLINKGIFINKVSFKNVWKVILRKTPKKNPLYTNKDIVFGGFVAWDNSPRKGKDSLIMTDSNPKLFEKYMNKHYENAKKEGVDFVFINAWNEWAEGAYLEPDEKYKNGYLEAIKRIIDNNKKNVKN